MITRSGLTIHGIVIDDGDPVVIRSMGGLTQQVPKSQIASSKSLTRSLMMSAEQLGLSAADLADLVAYMRK